MFLRKGWDYKNSVESSHDPSQENYKPIIWSKHQARISIINDEPSTTKSRNQFYNQKLEIKIVSGSHWSRWCIVDKCEIYITVTFIRFSTLIQCVLSLQREFDFDSYANKTIFFTIMPCTYFKLWYVDKYIQTVRQAKRNDAKKCLT